MKTFSINSLCTLLFLMLLLYQPVFSQEQIIGTWEGQFMNDFKTVVEIHADGENSYNGAIKMFSNENLIQNDVLSKIQLKDNQLIFRIESKETDFKGEINESFTAISGEFIFPDKSRHPLKLIKANPEAEKLGSVSGKKLFYNFPANQLQEDLDFLISKLKELHPQLYTYISAEDFNQLITKTRQNITSELTLVEYFNYLAPIVESIKCSHSGIRFPDAFQADIEGRSIFLPLALLFKDETVRVIKNFTGSGSLIAGDEITKINNVPVQTIKEKLYRYIPCEGMRTTTKNYSLNTNFNWLFSIIGAAESFEIEYIRNGTNHVGLLTACTFSELSENPVNTKNNKNMSFVLDENVSTGVLTLRAFMFPDVNKYIYEMDQIFRTLQQNKTKHLIIDLRGNSGGHPIFAAQLFSYLTCNAFTYFKRNNDVTEFEPLYNPMQPNKLQYSGNLYILTDGGCLSTTGHFISLLKHHTKAIFIGEEPGSTFRCNDFSVELRLPNTGIKVNIPRTTFETAIDDFNVKYPLIIDFIAVNSLENLITQTDGCMQFARTFISNSNP